MTEIKKFEFWPYIQITPILGKVKEELQTIKSCLIKMNRIHFLKLPPHLDEEKFVYQDTAQNALGRLQEQNIQVYFPPLRGIAMFPVRLQKLKDGKLRNIDAWFLYKDIHDEVTTYVPVRKLEIDGDITREKPIPNDWKMNTTGIYVV